MIKRFLCWLFILALSFCALSEAAPDSTVYESQKTYRLYEESIDLTGTEVYAPAFALESLGFAYEGQEGLVRIGVYEDFAREHTLTLKYASDDLSTLMFALNDRDAIVCLRNGRLIVAAFSYTRGVQDTYQALNRLEKSSILQRLASRNGVTFSPDGRYAVFVDSNSVVQMMRFDFQLIILDVESGELFLGYTWPLQVTKKGAAVVGACFDETGEFIYVRTYGTAYAARNSLLRYNIKTGAMEHMSSHEFDVDYSGLFRTADGTYVHGTMQVYSKNPAGLVVYKELGGKTTAQPYYFYEPQSRISIQSLDVNASTGQAMILALVMMDDQDMQKYASEYPIPSVMSGLVLPVLKDGVHHLQELIQFDPLIENAKRVSVEAYTNALMEMKENADDWPKLLAAALSPDGKYVFLIFGDIRTNDRFCARILNTETLALSQVEFDEGVIGRLAAFNNAAAVIYPVGANFISNDRIIINTDQGIKLFSIR